MAADYRYFFYSSEQMQFQEKMETKQGKNYKVGTVIYKGKRRNFTEMSRTNTSRYSDAKLVAEGDISRIKYTLPKGE